MSGTLRVVTIVVLSLGFLTACSTTPKQQNLVAEAYDSSGTLAGMAYKRSIFSTTDF